MFKNSFSDSSDFPFAIELDFNKLINSMELSAKANPEGHLYRDDFFSDPRILELRTSITNEEQLRERQPAIDFLMNAIFPPTLSLNEIKAATVPFTPITFYRSERFKNILEAAHPDYELDMRNLDRDNAYIFGCCLILGYVYKHRIDFNRPLYYDIPDKKGKVRHYRVLYNADFMEIEKTDTAPQISEKDFDELIKNTADIQLWRSKFPPGSYRFKGFGIANMYDSTIDESLSQIRTGLITRTPDQFDVILRYMRKFFGKDDLHMGIVRYTSEGQLMQRVPDLHKDTILLGNEDAGMLQGRIPADGIDILIKDQTYYTIPDVESYKDHCPNSSLYRNMVAAGAQSYIAAPLVYDDEVIGFIELASETKYFLNGLNAIKLNDILGIFSISMKQGLEDYHKLLEVIIQEECTSIHPSVSWRFIQEAAQYHRQTSEGQRAAFKDIIFENVYPLYGQCDIRGSSVARNHAIIIDLLDQLEEIDSMLDQALKIERLPLYEEVQYRVEQYASRLEGHGLVSGLDQEIINFIRVEVHPILKHLLAKDDQLNSLIERYFGALDPHMHMIYMARKNYDESVTRINQLLALELDKKAEQAQKMFPHFFERYKTDGVEFNMYIGQSLVKEHDFDPLYLQNLKLWQLTTICELEQLYHGFKDELATPLDIASLILAYSEPLSIRFRMDEKRFDVDGAYNARYEIIKKRVDKAKIKDTNERITQAGKLTVIYNNQGERIEYEKYAEYLRAINMIEGPVENHLLEDLQGVTGLRALRFTIKYPTTSTDQDVQSNGVVKSAAKASS